MGSGCGVAMAGGGVDWIAASGRGGVASDNMSFAARDSRKTRMSRGSRMGVGVSRSASAGGCFGGIRGNRRW